MRIFYGCSGAVLGAVTSLALVGATLEALDVYSMSALFRFLFFGSIGLLIGGWVGTISGLRIYDILSRDAHVRPTWTVQKVILVLGLFLGYPGLAIGAIQGAFLWHITPLSDSTLLADFYRHKATYDQIIKMRQSDAGLNQVSMSWTTPEYTPQIGVSPARIDQYRWLFNEAKIPDGFQTGSDGGTEFTIWSIGEATTSETSKGIVYFTSPPEPLFATLDNCHRGTTPRVTAYRHIEGNWYLFYDYIPG